MGREYALYIHSVFFLSFFVHVFIATAPTNSASGLGIQLIWETHILIHKSAISRPYHLDVCLHVHLCAFGLMVAYLSCDVRVIERTAARQGGIEDMLKGGTSLLGGK